MKVILVVAFCFVCLQIADGLSLNGRSRCPERCLTQRPKSDRKLGQRRRVAYFSTTRQRCRRFDFYGPRSQQSNIFVTIDACEETCSFCRFVLERRNLTRSSNDVMLPAGILGGLLKNVAKLKCLRSKGSDGVLELVPCNVEDGSQYWNAATIRAALYQNKQFELGGLGGKCLTVDGDSNEDGVKVKVADCVTSVPSGQAWMIVNGNYWENFQIKNARSGRCLTFDEERGVYLWDCTSFAGAPHQYFSLILPRTTVGILESVRHKQMCLHGKSSNPFLSELELTRCDVTADDQLIDLSGFSVRNPLANFPQPLLFSGWWCMDVSGSGMENGRPVIQWGCSGAFNQKWRLIGSVTGQFQIQNWNSGKCVSVENPGVIDQWDCEDDASHQFFTVQFPHDYVGLLQNLKFDTKCLHPKGTQELADLELIDCDQARNDEWLSIQFKSDPTVYISGKCLVVDAGRIRLQTCNTASVKQSWTIKIDDPQIPDHFRIENQATKKCISVQAETQIAVEDDCQDFPGGPQQHWKFI